MPRMQVYLPDELYAAVKDRELSPTELLQDAVRAEVRRQPLLNETDRYLAERIDEVGAPSETAICKAERLVGRVKNDTVATARR